ncbi:MAG: alpha/beta hydrolase [Rhodobacteraceae bacterium]|nr:alpha/beta hydrolase [Paracoccaceae bacterium]
MSTRLKILNFLLKWALHPILSRVDPKNPAKLRKWLDKPLEWRFRPLRGSTVIEAEMRGVNVLHINADKHNNGTLLYLHGGAYVFGSAQTHCRLVAHICDLCGLKGLSVNYRLAPENPFPAAIDDAFAVYQEMIASGTKNIILAGDSAGGGLALALLAKILAEAMPQPAGIVVFSPWTDLTLSGKSMKSNEKTDYVLPPKQVRAARDFYVPDDFKNPYASPVFANFENAAPVLIFASTTEVLLDDAVAMTKKLQNNNVDVMLHIYEKTPHVWPLFHGSLPEADQTLNQVREFIQRVLPN